MELGRYCGRLGGDRIFLKMQANQAQPGVANSTFLGRLRWWSPNDGILRRPWSAAGSWSTWVEQSRRDPDVRKPCRGYHPEGWKSHLDRQPKLSYWSFLSPVRPQELLCFMKTHIDSIPKILVCCTRFRILFRQKISIIGFNLRFQSGPRFLQPKRSVSRNQVIL